MLSSASLLREHDAADAAAMVPAPATAAVRMKSRRFVFMVIRCGCKCLGNAIYKLPDYEKYQRISYLSIPPSQIMALPLEGKSPIRKLAGAKKGC